ncbi:DNA-processing protein DprA [Microbacterium sp. SL75]|uniref:DNA-processing protein DprA n=1 Tax=Microbacterium sp. SL75 TaxID=2995140 RepID=UPI00226F6F67|nr:DNA-processing protein DprA [Microbacterium sp. SL75]WAC68656.1 DNA-processing protein DprA [Microbacterium sp. SL75]
MTAFVVDPGQARRALAGLRETDEEVEEAYARAVWSVLAEPGDGSAGALIATHGAVEALRVATETQDAQFRAARARWLPRLQPEAIAAVLDAARRAGASLVVPGDDRWPTRLDDLGDHAPAALWRRGGDVASDRPAVALVGARASTAYGEGVAADLAAELSAAGVVVVSGAAYGIDGAAHRAALSTGGKTLAFLAGGVDRAYPRGHESLLSRIASEGAVWSETPCGAAPTKWRFLARNRLIAAIADAVVVVEAGWRSGSLNTAAHAASLGRALGAVPGPVTSAASAGCHRILREFGGVCVTSSADVLEMIGTHVQEPQNPTDRTDETTRVIDALSPRAARSTVEIARRSGLSVDEAGVLLGFAELEGRVRRDDDGLWTAARSRGER